MYILYLAHQAIRKYHFPTGKETWRKLFIFVRITSIYIVIVRNDFKIHFKLPV